MNLAQKLFRSPFYVSLFIVILVFLFITGLGRTGNLEFLELAAYDRYIRLRQEDSLFIPPIVLISITENDIRNHGWPLSDAGLAKALSILAQYQARVVGLDIYRDIPVSPGSEELDAILTGNDTVVAAMKFGNDNETTIPPPAVLRDTDQTGFNDILVDPGGIVRRALLFMDDGTTTFYSFALRVSLLYLRAEGITPQPDEKNAEYIRLGRTTIPPFEPNDGGYFNADARGYQFLLDFKDTLKSFPTFTLTDLISGDIDSSAIKNKIVLVGYSAEGVKDFFYTPYSRALRSDQQISGVELHANIISQLLRFALERSTPVATVSEVIEWFWILVWCTMGGMTGFRVRSPWQFSLLLLCGLLLLGLFAYTAYLIEWWIPVVLPAIAWIASASVVTSYMSNREKIERMLLLRLAERESLVKKRRVFIIDMNKEPEKIRISGFEKVRGARKKTVRHYQEIKVDDNRIAIYNRKVTELLNSANQKGYVSEDILNRLKSTGHLLYDQIFTKEIKQKLALTDTVDMIISIDDNLVNIPWELIYDGNSFLCLRFNMGRQVRTRQQMYDSSYRLVGSPLKMFIAADPQRNLESAHKEGFDIRDKLDMLTHTVNVDIMSGGIKSTDMLMKIRNYDILHYAGHADYDIESPSSSGFLMEDGKLKASDIINMIGPKPLPSLVFSNACKSGHTDIWKVDTDYETEISGLANAFLLAGVRHYLGTFWDVQDDTSHQFAVAFYKALMDGDTVGEAVRKSRLRLIDRYGENTIMWASYVLYGDPTYSYVDFTKKGVKTDQQ